MLSNFIVLRNFIPWRRTILYIDVYNQFIADEKFIDAQVPIHFKGDLHHQDKKFSFILISFNKKYIPQVVNVLLITDKLLSIKYGQKYEDFKQEANQILNGEFEVEKEE